MFVDRNKIMSSHQPQSYKTRQTYCRICEALCGLEVDISNDGNETVLDVRADKSHPVSKGYSCIKGASLASLHDGENRVNYPLKRQGDRFVRISWDQAISEIGDRVKALQSKHGKRCLAHYMGNPSFFDFSATAFFADFASILGSPNAFCSHSIDLNNKIWVAETVYKNEALHPIPDLTHTDLLVCIGGNPLVSQMSVVNVTNVAEHLKNISKRGGKVVVVDPRKTETAKRANQHIFITPGMDVFFLLSFLNIVIENKAQIAESLNTAKKHAEGLDDFINIAKTWTPERTERLTGIDANTLRQLVDDYLMATSRNGAVLYMSTGVNMGEFGSLAYCLLQGINFICGNFDREGGTIIPEGSFDWLGFSFKAQNQREKSHSYDKTLAQGRNKVAGFFPAGALPEEILIEHPERIRALFISSGNPTHSVPSSKWTKAMQNLELCVCVDIYMNHTAREFADYVLPGVDMLEREDIPLAHQPFQLKPFAQHTPALVKEKYERRPEWKIFSDLIAVSGAGLSGKPLGLISAVNRTLSKIPFVKWRLRPTALLNLLLLKGPAPLKKLRQSKHGVPLPNHQPGEFFRKRWPKDLKFDFAPQPLLDDLGRVESFEQEFVEDHQGFYLIGRRDRKRHNSWGHFNSGIRQPDTNSALLHPDRAEALGVSDGETIIISSPRGKAEIPVKISSDVAKNVICTPHGWGMGSHQVEKSIAGDLEKGININAIIEEKLEPVSGQSVLTAQKVTVSAV